MDEYSVTKIDFLGEQDGAVEQEFKAKVMLCLEELVNIQVAYLARVSYDPRGPASVAICLRTADGNPDANVVAKINALFASMFNQREHLDVIFLSPENERKVSSVCTPFYRRQVTS